MPPSPITLHAPVSWKNRRGRAKQYRNRRNRKWICPTPDALVYSDHLSADADEAKLRASHVDSSAVAASVAVRNAVTPPRAS